MQIHAVQFKPYVPQDKKCGYYEGLCLYCRVPSHNANGFLKKKLSIAYCKHGGHIWIKGQKGATRRSNHNKSCAVG